MICAHLRDLARALAAGISKLYLFAQHHRLGPEDIGIGQPGCRLSMARGTDGTAPVDTVTCYFLYFLLYKFLFLMNRHIPKSIRMSISPASVALLRCVAANASRPRHPNLLTAPSLTKQAAATPLESTTTVDAGRGAQGDRHSSSQNNPGCCAAPGAEGKSKPNCGHCRCSSKPRDARAVVRYAFNAMVQYVDRGLLTHEEAEAISGGSLVWYRLRVRVDYYTQCELESSMPPWVVVSQDDSHPGSFDFYKTSSPFAA